MLDPSQVKSCSSFSAGHVAPSQEGQSLDGCVRRAREIRAGVGRFEGHRGPRQNLD